MKKKIYFLLLLAFVGLRTSMNAQCPGIVIMTTFPTSITLNSTFNISIIQSGILGARTWSISAGSLPVGLSNIGVNNGVISGTPTVPGVSNFTVQVTDGTCSQTRAYSVVVTCPTVSITTTSLQNGILDDAYGEIVEQTGLTGSVVWSVFAGLLPVGLSIDNITGTISGTPTSSGTFSFTILVGNGSCFQTKLYSIIVTCPTIVLTTPNLPRGASGVPYSQSLSQTGIIGSPIVWSINFGALPAGLSISPSTGVISGTPNATGFFSFQVRATRGACIGQKAYNIFVECPISMVLTPQATSFGIVLAPGTVGLPYSQKFTALGIPNAIYTYNMATPIPGLTFNTATGLLSGVPTNTFSSQVEITITSNIAISGCPSFRDIFSLSINPNPTTAIDNSLSNLVKVSPNPSNGDFQVDFSGLNLAKSLVRVYDAQGKQISSSVINANANTTISLDKMPNGIYLLEIEITKGRILKRLIKEN